MQLPEKSPAAQMMGEMILAALEQNPLVMSAALPLKIFPLLFNRYQGGQSFGNHVDNAIRHGAGTPHRIRTDWSATLFFSSPEEYDGGELVIEDTYGVHSVNATAVAASRVAESIRPNRSRQSRRALGASRRANRRLGIYHSAGADLAGRVGRFYDPRRQRVESIRQFDGDF